MFWKAKRKIYTFYFNFRGHLKVLIIQIFHFSYKTLNAKFILCFTLGHFMFLDLVLFITIGLSILRIKIGMKSGAKACNEP